VLAGGGDALDDLLGDGRLQLTRGQIIHEKQRRGALHGDVVHAMIHQIGADGRVQAHLESNL